jgi:cellulose biosynthesis protein BcsQ
MHPFRDVKNNSSIAVHLAYYLTLKLKKKVLLVDADAQRSSSQWIAGMDGKIETQVIQTPDDLTLYSFGLLTSAMVLLSKRKRNS